MKKINIFFMALVIIQSCTKDCPEPPANDPPQANCIPELTKGLLAYYPFNGNAHDASGNGNNGVPMNGAFFTTDYLGRPNKAAGFDGINDYIIVNDNGKLNVDTLTVSLLVQVNNTNRRHSIIGRWNFATATNISWGIGQSLDGINRWEYSVHKTACQTQYNFQPNDFLSHPESAMQPGRWYHILASFANGVQRLYINGELKASVTRNFQELNKCPNAQLIIGAWWQNDIVSIDGKIDEIRIYNRLLNSCEIKSLSSGFGE